MAIGMRRRAAVLLTGALAAALLTMPEPATAEAAPEVRVVDNTHTTPDPTTGAVFTKVKGFGGVSGAATGAVGGSSNYSWVAGDTVRWDPNLDRRASVAIAINRVAYQPDIDRGIADDAATVTVHHAGTTTTRTGVDLNGGATGYLDLGTFDFAGAGDEYVELVKTDGSTTRVDAVRFEITYRTPPQATDATVTTAPGTAVSGTLEASDPDGDPLTFALAGSPGHGTAEVDGPDWTYTPADGYRGADAFAVEVSTPDGLTATATVTVDVAVPGNRKPQVTAPETATTTLNEPVGGTLEASDPDGDPLTFALAGSPGHGTADVDGPDWTYTPAGNHLGADAFTVEITDGNSAPVTVTIGVTVERGTANRPPSAAPNPTAPRAISGWPERGTVEAGDPDGDAVVAYELVRAPRYGTVRAVGTSGFKTWEYTSRPHVNARDSFTVRVTDAYGGSTDVTVPVDVERPDDTAGEPPAGYELVWADEFAAPTLDTTEWYHRIGSNRPPEPDMNSAQRPENVRVVRDPNHPADGLAQIDLKKEDYVLPTNGQLYHYTGGGLITANSFSYGYYETRAKFFDKDGWHSAFWTSDGSTRTEIDGFEHDSSHPGDLRHNVITWNPTGLTLSTGNYDAGFDAADDFHVYGFEWTPEHVRFYVDNEPVFTAGYPKYMHEHGAGMLWLTAIAIDMGGDHDIDGVDLTNLGGAASGQLGEVQFDYFRYYAPAEDAANLALQADVRADSSLQPILNPSQRQGQGPHYNPPVKAVDGGRSADSDRWVSADTDDAHWLEVDLGRTETVRQVKFWTGADGYNLPLDSYRIQYSAAGGDGASWTDAVVRTGNTEAFVDEVFAPIRARYLRLYVPAGQGQVALYDLQAFTHPTHRDDDAVYDPGGEPPDQFETEHDGRPAIIVGPFYQQYTESGPGWSGSSVSGYGGTATRYTLDDGPESKSAQWTPIISTPGEYDVYVYRVPDPVVPSRNDPAVTIDVHTNGATTTTTLDTTGPAGWVPLGTFTFAAGTAGYVRATKSTVPDGVEQILRTSGVMFVRR